MKIVISSTGPTLKADVDPRFGRAPFLIMYETDTGEVIEAIDNAGGQDASQGAGISVAGLMAQKGVKVILTGRVGPKAMAVVDRAGIKVVADARGTVEEVINDFSASPKGPAPMDKGRPQGAVAGAGCQTRNRGQGKCHGGRGMGRGPGR